MFAIQNLQRKNMKKVLVDIDKEYKKLIKKQLI